MKDDVSGEFILFLVKLSRDTVLLK